MHPPKVAVFDVSDRHVDSCHKVHLGIVSRRYKRNAEIITQP